MIQDFISFRYGFLVNNRKSLPLQTILLDFLCENFFTHTLFCSGDFGLLTYLETNQEKEIYTYDDKEKGESYFFEKIT